LKSPQVYTICGLLILQGTRRSTLKGAVPICSSSVPVDRQI
jgi:hypothetical protein